MKPPTSDPDLRDPELTRLLEGYTRQRRPTARVRQQVLAHAGVSSHLRRLSAFMVRQIIEVAGLPGYHQQPDYAQAMIVATHIYWSHTTGYNVSLMVLR